MTEARAEALLQAIARDVLPDRWSFVTVWSDGPTLGEDGERAHVAGDYRYRRAYLSCAIGLSDEEVAQSLLHELLHVTQTEMEFAAMTGFDQLGAQAREMARVRWLDAEERQVVALEKHFSRDLKRWLRESKEATE